MFTWARSATRLIYALAREGLLPQPLARVDTRKRLTTSRRAGARRRLGAGARRPIPAGIPIETYIQLASGNFLLTYVLIVLTAWRLLSVRRWLPALVISSLAILALVVAGFQSLWYALAVAALFGVMMALRRVRRIRQKHVSAIIRKDAA